MGKRTRKNKNNSVYKKAIMLFILIFAIAIILVSLELNVVLKKKKELSASNSVVNTKVNTNIVEYEGTEEVEQINEGLSFDTFVDRFYSENDILNLSSSEMLKIRQAQIEKKATSSLSVQKVLGSAASENEALRIATNEYNNTTDQLVRVSSIALEADTYYIIKVEWDYVGSSNSKRYNQQVLVFKEFYYDMDKNILNMDDLNKVKDILDLKYYIETYSNVGKRLIQSYITKNGEITEYNLYYFEVEYGQEDVSDKIYLTVQKVQIDSASGKVIETTSERIKSVSV